MKTAIYISDGRTQLVLTPESAWEQSVIGSIESKSCEVQLKHGSFYECNGGWIREGSDDRSLIITVNVKPAPATLP